MKPNLCSFHVTRRAAIRSQLPRVDVCLVSTVITIVVVVVVVIVIIILQRVNVYVKGLKRS